MCIRDRTWSALEEAIEILEGGKTLIFASGMAAINAILSLLSPAGVIVAATNGYQGTTTYLKNLHDTGKLTVRFVDLTNTKECMAAIHGAQMVHLESPLNPLLDVVDLPKLISYAKGKGCGVSVDNTLSLIHISEPTRPY